MIGDIKWEFPSNSGGDEQGLNNSLIETFKDSPFKSLAREIVQNSLDAVLVEKKAIVEFKTFELDAKRFPNLSELIKVMESCKNFSRNEKTTEFFNEAINILNSEKIDFLRISDFNTKGLCGSDKERGTDWTNLVRSNGSSDKSGEKGGSFGIGKGAPFACSALRTIFYSTLDQNGLKASQGVSRLTSFIKGKYSDGIDDIAQGVGYLGRHEEHRILPVKELIELDNSYHRISSGTDIYISGLNKKIYNTDDELNIIIINEVLDGFIVAIWQEKLEVIINDILINKQTLPQIVEKYKDRLLKSVVLSFDVLFSKESKKIDVDIKLSNISIGNIKLALNLRLDGNNKISMVRSTGMKILDKDRLCPSLRFTGIAYIEGKKLNEQLIQLENPSHNRWEPNRVSNPKNAQKILNTIYDNIKVELTKFAENAFDTNIDIEGAGDFIPDLLDKEKSSTKSQCKQPVVNKIVKIEKESIEKVESVANLDTYIEGEDLCSQIDSEGNVIEGTEQEGFLHHDGNIKGEGNRDTESVNFEESGLKTKKIVMVESKHIRIFCIDKKNQIYRLIFTPSESSKKGYILINKVAELAEKEPVDILDVKYIYPLQIKNNKIGYFNFVEGDSICLDIKIEGEDYCSMEVKMYAYKS